MRKYIFCIILSVSCVLKANNLSPYSLLYGFDSLSEYYDNSSTSSTIELQVSQLSEGFHTIHWMLVDSTNTIKDIRSYPFYRVPSSEDVSEIWYWFNEEDSVQKKTLDNSYFLLDVSHLKDGLNHLNVQYGSTIKTTSFLKNPQIEEAGDLTINMIVDDKDSYSYTASSEGGLLSLNMDVTHLPIGIHKVSFVVLSPSGAATSAAEAYFIRSLTAIENSDMSCIYSIDGGAYTSLSGNLSNGTFFYQLPVENITNGLHHLDLMLLTHTGVVTEQQDAWFYKIPIGGIGINRYEYWLNEKNDSVFSFDVIPSTDSLQVISLIPVTHENIRSSCFHFESKNAQAKIYAKNDVHFRFYDNSGRWVDSNRQYVDYQMYRDVIATKQLTAVVGSESFNKISQDSIKWFSMLCSKGDSIAFRSSQATTVQVFSPSDKEVYNATGSESVEMDGIHAKEDGLYYIAVHDVTGSNTSMILDYIHLDKYAILDYDVYSVGNGGFSTITFEGNGFKDLYSVDLINNIGDTIHHIDIGHESDARTSVTFDFKNVTLGNYDAIFHFTLEDRSISNVLVVDTASIMELETSVVYPSSFLRGTSVAFNIDITNKGNMTAYMVPLEIKIITDKVSDIREIKFDGALKSLLAPDFSLVDEIDQETIDDISKIFKDVNDLSQFVFYYDTLENKTFGLANVLITIPANTTLSFTVSVTSDQVVHLEAWSSKYWFPVSISNDHLYRVNSRRAPSRESMCCMREKYECVGDVVANIAGAFMPPGANCVTSLSMTGLETAYDVWCSEGDNASDRWQNYLESQGSTLANRLIQSAAQCILGFYANRLSALRKDREMAAKLGSTSEVERITAEMAACRTAQNSAVRRLYDGLTTMIMGEGCREAFSSAVPNCPPDPDGGGGSSSPQNPSDPNDIIGYVSESGSMFISDSISTVSYIIEFENDTAMATASAHTVIVKDTLDASRFVLSSFRPYSVKIGDKEAFLSGNKNFVTTIDMRPEIYAIAQVEGTYDEENGVATWRFTSLDPMSLEETDNIMQGFLPVNFDGNGIGEVSYLIDLVPNMIDGTTINNRASITFDFENPILTPVWTNIVDAIAPTSTIYNVNVHDGNAYDISVTGDDNRSGVWKYNLYVQNGGADSTWYNVASNMVIDSIYSFIGNVGVNYGFFVQSVDSAGNMEPRKNVAEYTLTGGLKPHYFVNVTCNTLEGNVTGSGLYVEGQSIQIGATANDGYEFLCWSDGSTDNPKLMIVNSDAEFIAYFQSTGDVTGWDTNKSLDESVIKLINQSGHLIIIRNGIRYLVTGQLLD